MSRRVKFSPEFEELLSRLEAQRWVTRGLLQADCPECKAGRLILPPVRYKGQIGPNRICSNCGMAFLFSMVPLPRPERRWYEVYEPEVEPEQEEQWVRLEGHEDILDSIKRERGWQ